MSEHLSLKKIALSGVLILLALSISVPSGSEAADQNARGDTDLCAASDTVFTPKLTRDNRYEVGIGIQPIRVTNISPSNNIAVVDFYLTIEYPLSRPHANVKCVGHLADNVWQRFYNPDIEMMSIHDPETVQGHHWMVQNNRFAYMTRVKGSANIVGNFRYFPFDELEIPIIVAGEDSSAYMDLVPSKWYHEAASIDKIEISLGGIHVPGWRMENASFTEVGTEWVSETGEYWDELGITLTVKREPATKVARGLLPLLILFFVTFGSYTLRESEDLPSGRDRLVDTRIHVQIGTLLALFAYTLYLMELIPETAYLTLGDLTWMSFMVAIGLVLLSEYLPNEVSIASRPLIIKKLALRGAFTLVILLTGIYFSFYLLHG
ncbi:ligand-gated ion channel [Spiribacter roseus]|uniref:hypothetical protein n=1 Tax=Spiribacter roseus TaxID=1855875 RepID=UPI0012FDF704